MTTQDLKQIEQLLDKKLKDIPTKSDIDIKLDKLKGSLENTMGKLGKKIIEAVSISTAARKDFDNLTKRVEKLEEEFQTS